MKNKVVLVLGAVVVVAGIWFVINQKQGKSIDIKVIEKVAESANVDDDQFKESEFVAAKVVDGKAEEKNTTSEMKDNNKDSDIQKATQADVSEINIFNRKFHMVGDNIRTVEFTIDTDGNMTGIDSTFEYESESSSYKTYCNYSGNFTVTEIIDDYTFRVKLTDYKILDEDGKETIEEGMKNIASATDLFKDGQEFILYLSGRPVDDILDIASFWAEDWFYYEAKEPEYDILKTSLLYNSETKTGYSE